MDAEKVIREQLAEVNYELERARAEFEQIAGRYYIRIGQLTAAKRHVEAVLAAIASGDAPSQPAEASRADG